MSSNSDRNSLRILSRSQGMKWMKLREEENRRRRMEMSWYSPSETSGCWTSSSPDRCLAVRQRNDSKLCLFVSSQRFGDVASTDGLPSAARTGPRCGAASLQESLGRGQALLLPTELE